ATYMYEDDTPAAERRAQALSLDRDMLRELLGVEELRELLDATAIADVEASLRPKPRNADELHDLLLRAGEQLEGEFDGGFAETLIRERRAIRVKLGGGEAVVAAEDAGRYRDAFGVMPPGGRRSGAAFPPGTASGGVRPCAKRSFRCRRSPFPYRCGRARSCRAASPATDPSSSTRSARAGRRCGSAPVSTGSRSSSARTPP